MPQASGAGGARHGAGLAEFALGREVRPEERDTIRAVRAGETPPEKSAAARLTALFQRVRELDGRAAGEADASSP